MPQTVCLLVSVEDRVRLEAPGRNIGAAALHFTGLIGPILVGYVVFGDLPDLPTIIGTLIIVTSGLYVPTYKLIA